MGTFFSLLGRRRMNIPSLRWILTVNGNGCDSCEDINAEEEHQGEIWATDAGVLFGSVFGNRSLKTTRYLWTFLGRPTHSLVSGPVISSVLVRAIASGEDFLVEVYFAGDTVYRSARDGEQKVNIPMLKEIRRDSDWPQRRSRDRGRALISDGSMPSTATIRLVNECNKFAHHQVHQSSDKPAWFRVYRTDAQQLRLTFGGDDWHSSDGTDSVQRRTIRA
ncbi:hypothetical protein F5146DRAFT_999112 [Armillaria mellea]|nr:hypothetical protein F5146DRAFT_999112 [Armillaria mellea]